MPLTRDTKVCSKPALLLGVILFFLASSSAQALPPVTTISPDGASWSNAASASFSLSCTDPDGSCVNTFYNVTNDGDSCGVFVPGISGAITCSDGQVCTKRVCFYSSDNSGETEIIKASDIFRLDRDLQESIITGPGTPWTAASFLVSWDAVERTLSDKLECEGSGTAILTISKDGAGSIHVGNPGGDLVRCRDTAGTAIGTDGTAVHKATLLRLSELTNAHVEKSYLSTYANPIYISSADTHLECNYKTDCTASSYDTCLLSLSDDSDAHVAGCGVYNSNLCCKFDNYSLYISNYTVEYNETLSDGSPVRPWTVWLDQTAALSANFGSSGVPLALQNNHTYYHRVWAYDKSGNKGPYSAAAGVTFDNEPPEIAFSLSNDAINGLVTINSNSSDGVSGVYNYYINCTSPYDIGVQCLPANPFGGMSTCSTPSIPYEEETEVNCDITSIDRAGNNLVQGVYFTPSTEHPLVKLYDHQVFMSIGESHHSRIDIRNLRASSDKINVSIAGTYPQGLAYFIESSGVSWMSADKRNITLSLRPYERKTVYLKIDSTDAGDYTLEITGYSESQSLTDADGMTVTVGFPASFPGIEGLSIAILLSMAAAAYWRRK